MLKRIIIYGLAETLVVAVLLTMAGAIVKKQSAGRIAPGVTVCGRDVSGMTMKETEEVVRELVPDCVTELRCRFLPEMREEIEVRVAEINKNMVRRSMLTGDEGVGKMTLDVEGNEVILIIKQPILWVDTDETLRVIAGKSSGVKVWEWLYKAVMGQPFRIRDAEASFRWDEELMTEGAAALQKLTERKRQDATVKWEQGQVRVSKSVRGFRLDTETLWKDVQNVTEAVKERIKEGSVEGVVLRFYATGTALMPSLSTEQAEKCNTVLGTFTTVYTGAGNGRAQNIKNGAKKLHGKVVLPGEAFSVAGALMPFTVENGYAPGGTYIDGQLSESIGGGVCQLSSTLYNALLQTNLEITERHPHSMPVGYVPLGRDAAIAGDYKDLKFKNTTNVPVLLLCEATGTEVKVKVYGAEEVKRGSVIFESVITEENEEKVTVEVYRTETGTDEEERKEKVSEDEYRKITKKRATE